MLEWLRNLFKNYHKKIDIESNKIERLKVAVIEDSIQGDFCESVSRDSFENILSDESKIHWLLDHRKLWIQSKHSENHYYMLVDSDDLRFNILFDSKGPNVKVSNNEGWKVTLSKKSFQKWRGKYMAYHNGNLTDVEVI